MAQMTAAQTAAEIQRKAAAGVALTNTSNAANNAAYKTAVAAPKVTTPTANPVIQGTVTSTTSPTGVTTPAYTNSSPSASPSSSPTTTPTTSYVANGGQTLNDILAYKKSYESGKTGVAAYAANSYNNLAPELATSVKGMNAQQLEAYIMGKSGQGNSPTTAVDYNALATSSYDPLQAAYDAAAADNVNILQDRYKYANGVTQDNRTLQDGSFYRNNAPTAWDGSTGYQMADMNRNRSIEDHYTNEALTDATAAAYSQANAFRNNKGNYIATKANELQTAAQQSARDDAALTGYYNGQQTMQGASNAVNIQGQQLSNAGQQIANQIAQMDLSTYPQEKQLKIKQLQQQVASGAISNQTAQYQLSEMTNPNSVTNQASAIELQLKQIDLSTYSQEKQLKIKELQKSIEQIGKIPYQSENDQALESLKVQTAQAELNKLLEGGTTSTTSNKTYEDYRTDISNVIANNKKNPSVVQDYIGSLPISTYEKYRAWLASGYKWPDNYEVPTKGE